MHRSKWVRLILPVVFVGALAIDARGAEAGGSPGGLGERGSVEARKAAQAKYKKGVAAYSNGRFTEAIDLFRQADRLSPSAALSYNIARAYEKIGDGPSTLAWYRDYLRRSPKSDDAADVARSIDRLEAELAQKGVQQVTVLSTPNGATIVMDGQPVGVTPWTGELPLGTHEASMRLRGYADVDRIFTLSAADAVDVSATLVPEAPAPSAPPVPPAPAMLPSSPPEVESAPRSRATRTWGFVALGAGVGALGGALAFEMMRRSSEKEAEDATEQLVAADRVDRAESQANVARILAGAGGALAITGGVLLVVDAGKASSSAPRVGVACTGAFCGATAFGRFQ